MRRAAGAGFTSGGPSGAFNATGFDFADGFGRGARFALIFFAGGRARGFAARPSFFDAAFRAFALAARGFFVAMRIVVMKRELRPKLIKAIAAGKRAGRVLTACSRF